MGALGLRYGIVRQIFYDTGFVALRVYIWQHLMICSTGAGILVLMLRNRRSVVRLYVISKDSPQVGTEKGSVITKVREVLAKKAEMLSTCVTVALKLACSAKENVSGMMVLLLYMAFCLSTGIFFFTGESMLFD